MYTRKSTAMLVLLPQKTVKQHLTVGLDGNTGNVNFFFNNQLVSVWSFGLHLLLLVIVCLVRHFAT